MIELDKYEKQWILLIKGKLQDKYPYNGKWIDILKPLYKEMYWNNPDEDKDEYNLYLKCVFNKLLGIFLKIKEDYPFQYHLTEIFNASFGKKYHTDSDLAIERCIAELCSIIQYTKVINEDGTQRFDLIN